MIDGVASVCTSTTCSVNVVVVDSLDALRSMVPVSPPTGTTTSAFGLATCVVPVTKVTHGSPRGGILLPGERFPGGPGRPRSRQRRVASASARGATRHRRRILFVRSQVVADDLVLPFRLELSGDRPPERAELRSLRNWLRDDPRVGRHTLPEPAVGSTDPEHMGIVGDSLQFVADTGLDTMALIVAILAWRDSRPADRRPTVTIIYNDQKFEITGDHETIQQVIRALGRKNGDA